MASKIKYYLVVICFFIFSFLIVGISSATTFVPPVSGPIKYSAYPVDSEDTFDENIPKTWYTMVWSGRYSGDENIRYEHTGGHPGVDIRDAYGRKIGDLGIYAIGEGIVIRKRYAGGWGNFIVIKHDNVVGYGSLYSIYAHLDSFSEKISSGQEGKIQVSKGERIGIMGGSGGVQRHLHFQIDRQWADGQITPFWPKYTKSDQPIAYPSIATESCPGIDDCLTEEQRQEAASSVIKNTVKPIWFIESFISKALKRGWLASVVMGDGPIYLIGGGTCEGINCGMFGGNSTPIVESYYPLSNSFIKKSSLTVSRFGLAAAGVNGKIYVLGGTDGNSSQPISTVEEYNVETDTWLSKTFMPTARWKLTAAVINGEIYTIGGGSTGNQCSPTGIVEAYDPVSNSWATKKSMPTPRWGAASVEINGKIYVAGGSCKCPWIQVDPSSELEDYDPSTDTWSNLKPMPTARWDLAATAVNGKIYAIGGWAPNLENPQTGNVLATVEEYDPSTDKWTVKHSMPTARTGLTAVAFNGKIYTFGGFDSLKVTNVIEVYDPSSNTWQRLLPASISPIYQLLIE